MVQARRITAADIVDRETYGRERKLRRRQMIELKRERRVEVGPFATFHFENFATMLAQIHEMMWIENGGEAQLADELSAYNPLVPNGDELVATLMFEINDPVRREQELRRLAGAEYQIAFTTGNMTVQAVPDLADGVERTKDDGKTSAVHFLHFPFTAAEIQTFRESTDPVILKIGHENYGHMAVLSAATRINLAQDFA